jgi:hypothetical protein
VPVPDRVASALVKLKKVALENGPLRNELMQLADDVELIFKSLNVYEVDLTLNTALREEDYNRAVQATISQAYKDIGRMAAVDQMMSLEEFPAEHGVRWGMCYRYGMTFLDPAALQKLVTNPETGKSDKWHGDLEGRRPDQEPAPYVSRRRT